MNQSPFCGIRGTSAKDVNQHELVKRFAAYLKKSGQMKVPANSDIIKLAKFNELAPMDPDWFYTRAASICRHLYIRAPAGVGAMCKIYGANINRGGRPNHWVAGNRSVQRRILKELERMGLVQTNPKGGRILSPKGRGQLDNVARTIQKE